MANIYVAATATWNGKALKKGKKEISSFEKSIKSLGRTLGLTFGAAALVSYGKKAVDAFTKDEAAAKSLEIQLKNTGYAFSAPGVELYIASLQKATGVLDDQLRPALQTLLTASGSLTQSQRALAVALEVSAATGKSVTEVSAAMAKGFSGQTTALTRLGAGLSKATLASGDMNKILDELSTKFSGQARARLETYAGKMDLLRVASQNVSETIGKGIIDALALLGKDKSIESATTNMESFGQAIADAILGMGVLINKIVALGETTKLNSILSWLFEGTPVDLLIKAGKNQRTTPSSNFIYDLGAGAGADIARATEAKRIKDANKLRAAEIALLTKRTAVDQLKDKFDLERIGLTVALNNATDEETKLRLKAQLAILDNNQALATKYNKELEAAQAASTLATSFNNAASAITNTLMPALFTAAGELTGRGGRVLPPIETTSYGVSSGSGGGSTTVTVPVTVNPSTANGGVSSQDIEQTVQEAILSLYRQGRNQVPAGAI